jgi:hypothetical protein
MPRRDPTALARVKQLPGELQRRIARQALQLWYEERNRALLERFGVEGDVVLVLRQRGGQKATAVRIVRRADGRLGVDWRIRGEGEGPRRPYFWMDRDSMSLLDTMHQVAQTARFYLITCVLRGQARFMVLSRKGDQVTRRRLDVDDDMRHVGRTDLPRPPLETLVLQAMRDTFSP